MHEKLRCIKTSLYQLTKKKYIEEIESVVNRVNKITILAYQFIKLYILDHYESSFEILRLDINFILTVFKVITFNSKNSGRKLSKNKELYNNLEKFYKKFFNYKEIQKIDLANLSHILRYVAIDMLTNILNNIRMNFDKYMCNLINVLYREVDIKLDKKTIRKFAYKILYNGEKKISKKLDKYVKPGYFPETCYGIKKDPFKFLYYMIKINQRVEKYNNSLTKDNESKKMKLYQVMPQRTNIIPKYIPIDTTIILDILADKGISEYYQHKTEQDITDIWNMYFPGLHNRKNKKLLKTGNYKFNNLIYTDGYAVSLLQVHLCEKQFKTDEIEFKHLDELSDEELDDLNNYKLIGVDPGKRNIITTIDENRIKCKYSSCQRSVECLHKHKKKIFDALKTDAIKTIEHDLSNYNSKSTDIRSFLKYIYEKNKANNKLHPFYQNSVFRKYNWKTYIHTQQSEQKLINTIKEKYNENNKKICLMYGNWSQTKQMRNFIPTPGIGFKRRLAKKFKIITVDEFNTSKLCCTCHQETIKHLPNVNSLLRCKNVDCNKFYDRDVNGSTNILNLGIYYIKYKTRPDPFLR
jgi:hypothetical protein